MTARIALLISLFPLVACFPDVEVPSTLGDPADDYDGDGFSEEAGDCNDSDSAVHPEATEIWYDGTDADCDGASDFDADGDGIDAESHGGSSGDPLDCDDTDPTVFPGAEDAWYDGVDSDCDDADDFDADADGHARDPDGDDCDDADGSIHPDAAEIWYDDIDTDCDGASDYDADSDGFEASEDCDDLSAETNPEATEIWYDAVDSDCDSGSDYDADGDGVDHEVHGGSDCFEGTSADTDSNPAGLAAADIYPDAADTWYDGTDADCDDASDYDADSDGYDSDAHAGDDCVDSDASFNPGVTETWYDGIDSDCDGANDQDADSDGHESSDHGGDDCDDADSGINPDAAEVWYDAVDSDCDSGSDYDADGDGVDHEVHGGSDCFEGTSADTDSNPAGLAAADIYPDAADTWYDGTDADCDDASDYDADADGHDSDAHAGDDCVDSDDTINPGVTETWYDGIDSDCDGANDYDADADGYDSDEHGGDDCDDNHALRNPAGEECDGFVIFFDEDFESGDPEDAISGDGDWTCGSDWTTSCVATYSDAAAGHGIQSAYTAGGMGEIGFTGSELSEDFTLHAWFYKTTSAGGGSEISVQIWDTASDCEIASAGYIYSESSAYHSARCTGGSHGSGCAGSGPIGNSVSTVGWHELKFEVRFSSSGVTTDICIDQTTCLSDSGGELTASCTTADVFYLNDDGVMGYFDDVLAYHGSKDTELAEADARLSGENLGDNAGFSVSGAGDLNGDGLGDIIVGAYGANSYAGAAYVVLGPVSGDLSLADADAKLTGEATNDYAGASVAGVGDVDGDGLDDVLVGARGAPAGNSYAGVTYLVLGPVSGTWSLSAADAALTGEDTEAYSGASVSGAGDVDGDGLDDIIIGAYGESAGGAAYLLMGPITTASLSAADVKLSGENADDRAGLAVSNAGDVNGDGLDDILVGAYIDSTGGEGATYLLLGPVSNSGSLSAAEAKYTGTTNSGGSGSAVSGAQDVNGDGLDDILIGAVGENLSTGTDGAAYLILGYASGTSSLSSADARLTAEGVSSGNDKVGYSLSDAGDVDSDGRDDILIGAYAEDSGGKEAGTSYLLMGPVSGTWSLSSSDTLRLIGEADNDHAGVSVSGAGDVDGDGRSDILIGASNTTYLLLGSRW